MTAKRGTAVITKVRSGLNTGKFRFKLIGANGEPVGQSAELYTSKAMCKKTLDNYFQNFEIVDKSISK
jgi:hypothetical protein